MIDWAWYVDQRLVPEVVTYSQPSVTAHPTELSWQRKKKLTKLALVAERFFLLLTLLPFYSLQLPSSVRFWLRCLFLFLSFLFFVHTRLSNMQSLCLCHLNCSIGLNCKIVCSRSLCLPISQLDSCTWMIHLDRQRQWTMTLFVRNISRYNATP